MTKRLRSVILRPLLQRLNEAACMEMNDNDVFGVVPRASFVIRRIL